MITSVGNTALFMSFCKINYYAVPESVSDFEVFKTLEFLSLSWKIWYVKEQYEIVPLRVKGIVIRQVYVDRGGRGHIHTDRKLILPRTMV